MAVYNKPAPACNFAQTAAQAALRASRELSPSDGIAAISIRLPDAAIRYPGCDSKGPYRNALQAKMSIPFSAAAVLARGEIAEENYARVDDAAVNRLVGRTDLINDEAFTDAFPKRQGADISVRLQNGRTISARLDDVVAATPEDIRARFIRSASEAIGEDSAHRLAETVERCEELENARAIPELFRAGENVREEMSVLRRMRGRS
jgi:2-methylcitrate dehydratase PrpD